MSGTAIRQGERASHRVPLELGPLAQELDVLELLKVKLALPGNPIYLQLELGRLQAAMAEAAASKKGGLIVVLMRFSGRKRERKGRRKREMGVWA